MSSVTIRYKDDRNVLSIRLKTAGVNSTAMNTSVLSGDPNRSRDNRSGDNFLTFVFWNDHPGMSTGDLHLRQVTDKNFM